MKNYFVGLLLLSAITCFPPPASAVEPWPGMDAVRYCTGDTYIFDGSVCRAYIQGVTDAHEYFEVQGNHPKTFCLPDEKEKREAGEAQVSGWLMAFEERLYQKPIVLIVAALNDIFPCPRK